MDPDRLIIGAQFVYQTLGGETRQLSFVGHSGDERYVFHDQSRRYRIVLGRDAIEDRVREYK